MPLLEKKNMSNGKKGRQKERIWWLTVYLIDSGEGGHVNAVNMINGERVDRGRRRDGGGGGGGL